MFKNIVYINSFLSDKKIVLEPELAKVLPNGAIQCVFTDGTTVTCSAAVEAVLITADVPKEKSVTDYIKERFNNDKNR